MADTRAAAASPMPLIGTVTLHELFISLGAGWCDFRRAPMFGLFFSRYLRGGRVWRWSVRRGHGAVDADDLLGISADRAVRGGGACTRSARRLEDGEPLDWGAILGVVAAERRRQIPWMGAIIVIYFLFWTFLAHMIFALFMGLSVMTNVVVLDGRLSDRRTG